MPHLTAQMARILVVMPDSSTTLTAEDISAAVPNLRPLLVLNYLNSLYHLGLVCCGQSKAQRRRRTAKDTWRLSAEGRRVLDVFRRRYNAPF